MVTGAYQQNKGVVKGATLILIAYATAFFPRILNAMGLPAPINFVHFAVVPLTCGIVLTQTRVKDKQQVSVAMSLSGGLVIFLAAITASAMLNGAAIINIILDFLLLTEHFVLLLMILCVPFSPDGLKQFRRWILGFGFSHLFLALAQKIMLDLRILKHTRLTIEDNVQGVFYLASGGHVVAATVTLCFCLYYFISAKTAPLWLRFFIVTAGFLQIQFADAKQVMLVAFAAWVLTILSRFKNIGLTVQYLVLAGIVISIFWWCIWNVDFFQYYRGWIRPEIYTSDGDATVLKLSPLQVIPTYFESPLNWLFGLGPGHTIGRLGGWMIRDYWNLLGPLGATTNSVTQVIWDKWLSSYLNSSMFSPFWGWAAIWGDLGFVGLLAFLNLWRIVWQRLCPDSLSRFIVLNILVNGLVFTLMEEPGLMLSAAVLIGLIWTDRQLAQQQRQREQQLAYAMQAASYLSQDDLLYLNELQQRE
ncbi:hypothetical protein H6F86_01835 [Phormidium sp. FACHB-592]|uniref:O-antigen polymerase n=1 Tax=Stenomitos frigidus AS-A4 TaxID=2933935 RepID=A0ABV0KM03_9CYAN|nr:hypothetical protein [Phormidium sp. FACHB-592]MBD2072646.1 hypothetical protein [Phormidium sp. FACHB-592]